MSKIVYIKEQYVLPATPSTPDVNYSKLYQKTNGLWYELDALGVERLVNFDRIYIPPIVEQSIVTHLGAGNNQTTNALTSDITYPYDANYMLTLSFNYNVDANNAYGKYYATLGGAALDLDDRSADPQGANQILVVEMKDNGNTSSGAITGTGSGIKMPYHMQFYLPGKTAGTESLVIDVGCQTAGVEASIWNIIAKTELISLI